MLRFHPPDAERRAGAVCSAVLVDARALVLFGAASAPLPASGEALFADGGAAQGVWRSVNWRRPGDEMHSYFAVLGVETVTQLHSGAIRIVNQPDGVDHPLPPVGRVDLEPEALIEELQTEGAPPAVILDFLHRVVDAPGLNAADGLHGFRMAALNALSRQSGFVEIIGCPDCGGLLVQGWSSDLVAGQHSLILQHDRIKICDGVVATFGREDLIETAFGTVAFLKDADANAASGLKRIYFAAGDDYCHLEVVQEPVRLAPADSVRHLEQMLPALEAEDDVCRAFKRVCRPRFGGLDTAATMAAPVRLSVDRALRVPGVGFFLSGWMLDPADRVQLVLFKSTGNFYSRIHDTWHRTRRADVVAGYAQDELFQPLAARLSAECGFMVFLPHAAPVEADEQFYVEIVLNDESCAFLPVAFDARAADAAVADILGTVDVDDLAFEDMVEMHLGPLVGGVFGNRGLPELPDTMLHFGDAPPVPPVSIVLPVTGGGADIDINLSRLAGDPDMEAAELIVVAAEGASSSTPVRIRDWANFYGFNGRLVVAGQAMDRFDAFDFGAQQAAGELLLFLSDSVLPDAPGWLGALMAELADQSDIAAISPTLLYEDFSIRYAGLPVEAPPTLERNGLRQLTGYPVHWLDGRPPARVHGVSEDCVLVRRSAFEQVDGFARSFTGPELKGVDFSLRLGQAGLGMLWTPSVTLFALDDAPDGAEQPYWQRPARRIDAWRLARTWADVFAPDAIPDHRPPP